MLQSCKCGPAKYKKKVKQCWFKNNRRNIHLDSSDSGDDASCRHFFSRIQLVSGKLGKLHERAVCVCDFFFFLKKTTKLFNQSTANLPASNKALILSRASNLFRATCFSLKKKCVNIFFFFFFSLFSPCSSEGFGVFDLFNSGLQMSHQLVHRLLVLLCTFSVKRNRAVQNGSRVLMKPTKSN